MYRLTWTESVRRQSAHVCMYVRIDVCMYLHICMCMRLCGCMGLDRLEEHYVPNNYSTEIIRRNDITKERMSKMTGEHNGLFTSSISDRHSFISFGHQRVSTSKPIIPTPPTWSVWGWIINTCQATDDVANAIVLSIHLLFNPWLRSVGGPTDPAWSLRRISITWLFCLCIFLWSSLRTQIRKGKNHLWPGLRDRFTVCHNKCIHNSWLEKRQIPNVSRIFDWCLLQMECVVPCEYQLEKKCPVRYEMCWAEEHEINFHLFLDFIF